MQFKRISSKIYVVLLLFFAHTASFASIYDMGKYYLTGSLSFVNSSLAHCNSTLIYYNNQLSDVYALSRNHENGALVSLSGGYELPGQGYIPAIAIGLGIYANPNNLNYNGRLIETAVGDPSSVLYDYKFTIQSIRYMVEAQLSWEYQSFIPFLNLGIGWAQNRFSGYQEHTVDDIGYVVQPPFQSNTQNNFAYQVGVGIGYAFNLGCPQGNMKLDRIALGYRFVNSGSVSSGVRDRDYPYYISYGDLRSNEYYLSYTHLF